jgi:hypothetical protein
MIEKVATNIILFVLSALCCVSCFTDNYRNENRVLHPRFVTNKGLWNSTFRNAHIGNIQGSIYTRGGNTYVLRFLDFMNVGVFVAALATLMLLMAPITTCFYPHIVRSIMKTMPLVVSTIYAFTNFKHGIGFASFVAGPITLVAH